MPNCEGNKDYNDGFLDAEKGIPHKGGRGNNYDDGYARGYETGERQSANQQWFENFKNGKVKI